MLGASTSAGRPLSETRNTFEDCPLAEVPATSHPHGIRPGGEGGTTPALGAVIDGCPAGHPFPRERIAAQLGRRRPGQSALTTARDEPDAFAPKHRWAMDWYYPVLCGAITGESGRERLAHRYDAFITEDWGVRCVSDRPWITAAETCECAMAHLAVGETDRATELFTWAQRLRTEEDRYWTGIVLPDQVHFPGGEQSTYTSSAIILAADALVGASPASRRPHHHQPG